MLVSLGNHDPVRPDHGAVALFGERQPVVSQLVAGSLGHASAIFVQEHQLGIGHRVAIEQDHSVHLSQFGHLAFQVDDLELVIEEVKKRGWWYRESKPSTVSRYIFEHDPDGYDIEILQAR